MLSLGIGQKKSSNLKKIESTPFCILFETQNIFKSDVKCDQNKVRKQLVHNILTYLY